MHQHRLTDDPDFMRLMDAQLLISAQTTISDANALYSATALDLVRQGTYAVEGGMGGIAEMLASRLTDLGGQVLYRKRVCGFGLSSGRVRGVYVQTGKRASSRTFMPTDFVVANLTPDSLNQLLGEYSPLRLHSKADHSRDGWGAFVLHLGVDATKLPAGMADHQWMIMIRCAAVSTLYTNLPGFAVGRSSQQRRGST
jgi:phytoene dehydrogenase-like protein